MKNNHECKICGRRAKAYCIRNDQMSCKKHFIREKLLEKAAIDDQTGA